VPATLSAATGFIRVNARSISVTLELVGKRDAKEAITELENPSHSP